jgi:GntR family transcriptional regulator/MocR family aminotransferase
VAFVRAVVCEPDDLIITSGAQQAFDLLARLLVTPGQTRVAVENPGYPPLRAAFIAAGARLVPVPVDGEGLQVDRLPADTKVICVTPSHQSPTGAVMSSARRAALLARARALDAVVIEDDYDGEFLYDAHPQDALQTLDRDGRVFYVGTFSKSLFPTLRKGFVVTPDWAREALIDVKRSTDSHTDAVLQATLAAFIAEGHLARHVQKMRALYKARRSRLLAFLRAELGSKLKPIESSYGMHITALSSKPLDFGPIAALLARENVRIHDLERYYVGKPAATGLIFGYGTAEPADLDRGLSLLRAALVRP